MFTVAERIATELSGRFVEGRQSAGPATILTFDQKGDHGSVKLILETMDGRKFFCKSRRDASSVSLQHEKDALVFLRTQLAGSELVWSLPDIPWIVSDGTRQWLVTVLVKAHKRGIRRFPTLSIRTARNLAKQQLAWLESWWRVIPPKSTWYRDPLAINLHESSAYGRLFGDMPESGFPMHGDFTTHNAIFCRDHLHIFDWDNFTPLGSPFFDMFSLLFDLATRTCRINAVPGELLGPRGRFTPITADFAARILHAIEEDTDFFYSELERYFEYAMSLSKQNSFAENLAQYRVLRDLFVDSDKAKFVDLLHGRVR